MIDTPHGFEWTHHAAGKFWAMYKIEGAIYIYVDEEPHGYEVREIGTEGLLQQFNTLPEAKHYCHMLVITGAI